MFSNLKNYFSESGELVADSKAMMSNEEVQISILALLLTAARVDESFDNEELGKICSSMYRECGLTEQEVGELVEVADFLVRDKGKVDYFIDLLNTHCSMDKKQIILGIMWRVIIADGKIDAFEGTLAADVRKRLGLSLEQSVYARKLGETRETQFLIGELMKNVSE